MLKKQGYEPPTKWLYPIDPTVDYRLEENRLYLVKAWSEAMYHTGELNQQLRLMDASLPIKDELPEEGTEYFELIEEKLWLAFLWGCCYNLVGPWVIMNAFPVPPWDMEQFADWYNENFERIRFDTDCRYRKSKMIACVQSYVDWLDGRTQAEAIIEDILKPHSGEAQYEALKNTADNWKYYGRLSTWNYIEAVALVTGWEYGLDCSGFMLTEVSDSESNRNGVAFITGNDDLTTKHGKFKQGERKGEKISYDECKMLDDRSEEIFAELVDELGHIDPVLRLNVETIYCWTKKRFRVKQSRYLGWDADRTYDDIKFVEELWDDEANSEPLWAARKMWLPDFLLSEETPSGKGYTRGSCAIKMAQFFETGVPLDLIRFQAGEPWYIKAQTTDKPAKNKKTRKLW